MIDCKDFSLVITDSLLEVLDGLRRASSCIFEKWPEEFRTAINAIMTQFTHSLFDVVGGSLDFLCKVAGQVSIHRSVEVFMYHQLVDDVAAVVTYIGGTVSDEERHLYVVKRKVIFLLPCKLYRGVNNL